MQPDTASKPTQEGHDRTQKLKRTMPRRACMGVTESSAGHSPNEEREHLEGWMGCTCGPEFAHPLYITWLVHIKVFTITASSVRLVIPLACCPEQLLPLTTFMPTCPTFKHVHKWSQDQKSPSYESSDYNHLPGSNPFTIMGILLLSRHA